MADVNIAKTQQEVKELNPKTRGVIDVFLLVDDFDAVFNAFELFDADGDGKLTEAEVIAALTRKTGQGTELSEEVARATWRRWQYEFDIDNDGTISYKEMRKRRNEVNQARATANALTPGNA